MTTTMVMVMKKNNDDPLLYSRMSVRILIRIRMLIIQYYLFRLPDEGVGWWVLLGQTVARCGGNDRS